MRQPVLFLSHGAPSLPLEPGATGALWKSLSANWARPRAILVISAHWQSPELRLSAVAWPATLHDFSGFPESLYRLQYPAPGDPALASEIAGLLRRAGIAVELDSGRGFDHGVWVPLMFLAPEAQIPVLPLSLVRGADPAWYHRLGQALAPLREQDILILASGSASHNLRALFQAQADDEPAWYRAFMAWLRTKLAQGDSEALLAYRRLAPHAAVNHPTDEHLLPLFVALGAADGRLPEHFDPGTQFSALSMDAWRWST